MTMSGQMAQCPNEGNPDFYGLGIRVGIYLQLATAIFARYFHPEAIPENLTANAIFLLALYVAVATATLGPGLRSEEIVILLQLCFGFLLSVLSILGGRDASDETAKRPDILRPPPIASFLRLMLTVAIGAYAVWFWFPGKDKTKIEGCPAYMFFLTKTSIYGGVRIFFQIQLIFFVVPVGALFLWQSSISLLFYISTLTAALSVSTHPTIALLVWWAKVCALDTDTVVGLGSDASKLGHLCRTDYVRSSLRLSSTRIIKMTNLMVPLVNAVCFLWTVLSVELTPRFNRINGVYDVRSTGQLIPFVIGLVRLVSLCHGIVVGYFNTRSQQAKLVRRPGDGKPSASVTAFTDGLIDLQAAATRLKETLQHGLWLAV
ncbi:MAG: hypothetical protein Q9186_005332 [Xanthomendoza sp. 1 TL-2023]